MATDPQPQVKHPAVAAPRLTPGTIVLVCLLAIAFCAAVPWISLVAKAGDPSNTYLPVGPLALLAFVCWVLAPLVRRWSRSSEGLVRAGLLFYALTVSIGGFATVFTVLQVPQVIASLKYFAAPSNRFEEEAIPAIAETLLVTNQVAARGFFEGARTGGVPWEFWLGPMTRWGLLSFFYLVTGIAMLGIFRRRWIDHERLAFPLAEIPLFIAGHGQFGMSDAAVSRVRLMAIGIVLGGLMPTLSSLHGYLPVIPEIPRNFDFSPVLANAPWNRIAGQSHALLWFDPSLTGIAYLMPSAIALSIVVFYLLMIAILIFSRFLGDPTFGPLQWNSWRSQMDIQGGAYIGLLLFVCWAARSELGAMVRDLWADLRGGSRAGRHPDRGMLLAFLLGFAATCWWSVSAGMSVMVAPLIMLASLAVTFGYALAAAQSGLPQLGIDTMPAQLLTAFVPARILGLRNMALMGMFRHMFSSQSNSALQPQAIHGLKIADSERFPDRRFITALLVAGLVLIALNSATMLHLSYNRSVMLAATSRLQGLFGNMTAPYFGVFWGMNQVEQANPSLGFHWTLLGAALMWGLQFMYRQFLWWPIHPLGMLIPCGWLITSQWFPVFVGWLVSRGIAKYAGARSYLHLRPVFVGMVLGGALTKAAWVVVGLIIGPP